MRVPVLRHVLPFRAGAGLLLIVSPDISNDLQNNSIYEELARN